MRTSEAASVVVNRIVIVAVVFNLTILTLGTGCVPWYVAFMFPQDDFPKDLSWETASTAFARNRMPIQKYDLHENSALVDVKTTTEIARSKHTQNSHARLSLLELEQDSCSVDKQIRLLVDMISWSPR